MKSGNQVDVHLQFGDDSEEKKLLECNISMMLGEQASAKFQIDQQPNNDVYFQITFHVLAGREKETVEYLERAMDEPDKEERKLMSPIQQLLRRPKSTGKVHFEERTEMVIVRYTFYEEYSYNDLGESTIKIFERFNEEQYQPNIKINMVVRGEESEKIKDRTNLLPNFFSFDLSICDYEPKKLFQILHEAELLPAEIMQNPVTEMLSCGLKRAKINFELASMRKIARMYREAAELESQYKPDKYLHKNLLKRKIEVLVMCRNVGAMKAEVEFLNQNHIQRALKVLGDVGKGIADS